LGELATAHAGHDDVGDQKMDAGAVLLAEEKSFSAVLGLENVVPVSKQNRACHGANRILVLDE
jgi:hypothetical protein